MQMQRLELDVSVDIVDRILYFLKDLPKDKVKFTYKKDNFIKKKEQKGLFKDFLNDSVLRDEVIKYDRDELHGR